MQRKHKYNAAPAVNGGCCKTDGSKKLGQQTRTAHEDDPGIGPDEGRAHKAHDDEDMQHLFAGNIIPSHQVGNGYSDQRSGQHRRETHHHRTKQ